MSDTIETIIYTVFCTSVFWLVVLTITSHRRDERDYRQRIMDGIHESIRNIDTRLRKLERDDK